MPISYTIDVPMAMIITRCIGHVTLAEVQDHFKELASAWPPVERLDVLLDLTEQTSLPALQDLEEVARTIAVQIGTRHFGRCAVVSEQAFLSESMQMWEVFVGRFFDRIEIFRSQAAALLWLQPKPKVRPMLTQH
ncbi:MAG TPA: STAS/SEC14 domain-containing protein [Vicinamibacterales bacterium]|nr:STAS/SEC14 domain-containing protein [Vicinamibacterales bacterium]